MAGQTHVITVDPDTRKVELVEQGQIAAGGVGGGVPNDDSSLMRRSRYSGAYLLKTLLLTLLLAAIAYGCQSEAHPTPEELARSVVTLSQEADGLPICTGVAVAPHVVYTAKHCVYASFGFISFPAMPYFNHAKCPEDRVIADDGTDNVLVWTCQEYKHWVKLATGSPAIGDSVQLIGHVLRLPLQYRRGYLASRYIEEEGMYPGSVVWVWDLNAAGGDSGGPFFNDAGQVMCVTSHGILHQRWPHFALTACYPPKFTKEQLKRIK